MRIALLAFYGVLIMASMAMADVTTEILSQQKAPNGDLWICTQYKIDGVEVQSPYSKVNGKSCFMIRKNIYQLAGLDNAGIMALVDNEIKQHAENLIADEYSNKAMDTIITNASLIGRKQIISTAVRKVAPDKEWTVKTDGTKIEKTVVVEPVIIP